MKKMLSLCLTVVMLLGIIPMPTLAVETEGAYSNELEQKVKNSSKAEIRDANGNVLETLDFDVNVQQITSNRSSNSNEYVITCAARLSDNDDYSDDDTQDGYLAVITMVCKDVPGTENILISVTGSFSGSQTDTKDRKVTYASYDTSDRTISEVPKPNVGLSYSYTPIDFTGFTFRAWAEATIKETNNSLYVYVSTDAL